MHKMLRFLGASVAVFGIIGMVVGILVFYMAYDKQAWMTDAMRQEKVQLAQLGVKGTAPDQIIDSAATAQAAADTVRAHRHSIAPTYSDLMAGGKYDPTNIKHLTYAQAMNLENYLYLGVLGFGVAQMAMGLGAFMVMTGLSLGIIGIALFRLASQLKAA